MYAVVQNSEVIEIRDRPLLVDGVLLQCYQCGSEVKEGWTYKNGAFSDERLNNITWDTIREFRNQKLMKTDWIALKAYESGSGIIPAWVQYRQKLRDITKNFANPKDVIWPEEPTS